MPAEPCYRAAPAADLARTELDGLTAVFDRRSGQSHLLAAPLPEILAAMGDRDWILPDLVAAMVAAFDLVDEHSAAPSPSDASELIATRLTELAALGLVEIR